MLILCKYHKSTIVTVSKIRVNMHIVLKAKMLNLNQEAYLCLNCAESINGVEHIYMLSVFSNKEI